jgi:hypothetical protein
MSPTILVSSLLLVAASSYSGLEKHLLRCRSVPEEIKQQIALARSQHAQQRLEMKFGAQQNFFRRLWELLQKTNSTTPDLLLGETLTSQQQLDAPPPRENTIVTEGAFADHLSVLDHLRSNKVSADIEEAMDRYYSALDYAGRVYKTSAMPDHFSAEWLLAKLVPKRSNHALRNVG